MRWMLTAIALTVTCSALYADGTPDDALYIVVKIISGTPQIVFARPVRLQTPLRSAKQSSADGWAASIHSSDGNELYRTQSAESLTRVEYDDLGEINRHVTIDPEAPVVMRVPLIPNTRVQISDPAGRTIDESIENVVNISNARETALASSNVVFHGPAGPPDNRVDLLIMGDGYTAGQESKFFQDATSTATRLFSISPYKEYQPYFNAVLLFTPSQQSGADHPSCNDPAAAGDPRAGQKVDTAFDATFCGTGVFRGVTVSPDKVYAEAAAYPDWDQILVLVNDDTYGGSGGDIAVVSTNVLSAEIAQHEFGHSFSGLTDEYSDPWPFASFCSDLSGNAPCEPNATNQTNRSLLKWRNWVDAATPVPTPPSFINAVGLFTGARYHASGFYRPRFDCLMNHLRTNNLPVPLCEICSEAFILRLYAGWDSFVSQHISLIEPGTTGAARRTVLSGASLTLSAVVIQPSTGGVQLRWFVDDGLQPGATSNAFTFSSKVFGAHRVKLEATDSTTRVRPNLSARGLVSSYSWEVVVAPTRTRSVRH